jgi:hypothetical protein
MFYRSKEQLKAQLEERLRTAFDFATLGAYEPEAPSRPTTPRETPKRVFLFAKVSTPCPHSRAAADTCDAPGTDTAEHQGVVLEGRSLVGTRRRSGRSRRGGAVKLAPQPCTWAAHRSD